ncbi:MAG: SRPBCC family protein [Nannocystaceae bacterium]
MPSISMSATVSLMGLALLGGLRAGVALGSPSVSTPAAVVSTGREIHVEPSLVPAEANNVKVRATVEIEASADRVWEAVLDFDARARETWLIDRASVYATHEDESGYQCRVRWDLSVMGIQVAYHTVYTLDRSTGQLSWTLDDDRANDLHFGRGRYQLVAADSGAAPAWRLIYTFEVRSSHAAPLWLRRRLTVRGVKTMLASIRDRAERRLVADAAGPVSDST